MLVQEAGTCQFMDSAANVVIEGCASIGKSYLGMLHSQAGLQDARELAVHGEVDDAVHTVHAS